MEHRRSGDQLSPLRHHFGSVDSPSLDVSLQEAGAGRSGHGGFFGLIRRRTWWLAASLQDLTIEDHSRRIVAGAFAADTPWEHFCAFRPSLKARASRVTESILPGFFQSFLREHERPTRGTDDVRRMTLPPTLIQT
jgi:hypothetical protein